MKNVKSENKVKEPNDNIVKRLLGEVKRVGWGVTLGCLLSALSIACSLAIPIILSDIIDQLNNLWLQKQGGIIAEDISYLIKPLILLFSFYTAVELFAYVKMLIMNNVISRHFTCAIRMDMSDKIARLPVSYVDKTQPGEVLSRMTSDVSVMGNSVHGAADIIVAGMLQIIGISVMMFIYNWQLALIVVAFVPFSMWLSSGLGKRSEKYFDKLFSCGGKLFSCVEETYGGYMTIKAFNLEKSREAIHTGINGEMMESETKGIYIASIVQPIIAFANSISYVIICLLGGYFAVSNLLTVGGVVAIILYSKQLANPLEQIADGISGIQRVKAASKRVYGMLDQAEMAPIRGEMPSKIKGNVDFEHISFRYTPDKPLISDLNISVKSGQKIAIVGPTGAGKTTIVNLLMRFYDLDSGKIIVDGTDISAVSRESVRNVFSMVLQDTWLFKGTIFENVAYGKEGVTREEVEQACDSAYAHHFIRTLPQGYDTEIDESTANLSSGQKQLLTIARAFLSDRALLILDEATSNVDTRTEGLIQKAMDKLMHKKTCFVIAHRLSTIVNADLILVINKGDIVEMGTHKELLEKDGFYAEIFNSQYSI
ncbi:MAG: ABC transporter ATP-binding protein [Clostridia bacterium]|nr:ABC transporter ATP-binding protein [Clostridia bacterium]